MKFKQGDKIKILRSLHGHEYPIGSIRTIDRIDSDGYIFTSGPYFVKADEIKLVNGKKEKILPTQFVVTYDEVSRDPYKTFTSKKEMNGWLKEAKSNTSIKFETIRVYEVKRTWEVKTSFTLKRV